MKNLILNNLDSVITIIVFLIGCIFLLKRGYTKKVKKMLLYLVFEAEKQLGSGTGDLKYSKVTSEIYTRLPGIMKILFTHRQIDNLIESSVLNLKYYLEDGSYHNDN